MMIFTPYIRNHRLVFLFIRFKIFKWGLRRNDVYYSNAFRDDTIS